MKEITSTSHPVVSHLVKLKKSRQYRKEEGSLLLEGKNAIFDVTKKHKAKRILITKELLKTLPTTCKSDELICVSDAIIEKITATKTPVGIVAELYMPKPISLTSQTKIVVLDGIQDPGNLGTILRTCVALGWQAVYLVEPCCDPFNDKALRAAKGATFDIAIQQGSWADILKVITKNRLVALVADLDGSPPEAYGNEERIALILGNEANGATPPKELLYQKVSIPMKHSMESLNVAVAGGILMYALKGKRA